MAALLQALREVWRDSSARCLGQGEATTPTATCWTCSSASPRRAASRRARCSARTTCATCAVVPGRRPAIDDWWARGRGGRAAALVQRSGCPGTRALRRARSPAGGFDAPRAARRRVQARSEEPAPRRDRNYLAILTDKRSAGTTCATENLFTRAPEPRRLPLSRPALPGSAARTPRRVRRGRLAHPRCSEGRCSAATGSSRSSSTSAARRDTLWRAARPAGRRAPAAGTLGEYLDDPDPARRTRLAATPRRGARRAQPPRALPTARSSGCWARRSTSAPTGSTPGSPRSPPGGSMAARRRHRDRRASRRLRLGRGPAPRRPRGRPSPPPAGEAGPLFRAPGERGLRARAVARPRRAAAILRSGYLTHAAAGSRRAARDRPLVRAGPPGASGCSTACARASRSARCSATASSAACTRATPVLELDEFIPAFRELEPLVARKLDPRRRAARGGRGHQRRRRPEAARAAPLRQESRGAPRLAAAGSGAKHDAVVAELDALGEAVDAMADARLAESVYQLAQGNFDARGRDARRGQPRRRAAARSSRSCAARAAGSRSLTASLMLVGDAGGRGAGLGLRKPQAPAGGRRAASERVGRAGARRPAERALRRGLGPPGDGRGPQGGVADCPHTRLSPAVRPGRPGAVSVARRRGVASSSGGWRARRMAPAFPQVRRSART